jgi:hypothetical protein
MINTISLTAIDLEEKMLLPLYYLLCVSVNKILDRKKKDLFCSQFQKFQSVMKGRMRQGSLPHGGQEVEREVGCGPGIAFKTHSQ